MPTNADTSDEIEIDVMRLVSPILFRWKIIALALIVVVAARGGALFVTGFSYSAVATLAFVKTRTDVQFDERIRTSQPDFQSATLAESQRNTVLALAQSPRIALRAIQKFADRLPSDTMPYTLLQNVDASLATRSDAIRISVEMQDAKLASDLATFWAQEVEREANAVFSGVTPEYVAQIDSELQRAVTELDTVQREFVTALRRSQMDALRLTVNQKVREMDRLEALKLLPTLGSLQRKQSSLSAVAVIGEMQERARQLKTAATAMSSMLQQGGAASAASNVMALAALKMQVFTVVAMQSNALTQLDLTTSSEESARNANKPSATRRTVEAQTIGPLFPSSANYFLPQEAFNVPSVEEQVRDLDALIRALTDLDAQLSRDIQAAQAVTESVTAPMPENVAGIDAEISRVKDELREARAGLEEESFLLEQMEQKRDTLQSTVESLRKKRAEVDVSSALGNSFVRLASEAVTPTSPTTGFLRALAIAGAAGLGVGVLIALVLAVRAGDYRRRSQEA